MAQRPDFPLRKSKQLPQNERMSKVPAIILAAGRGKRLADQTEVRPKCLLKIGGQSLVEHQLEYLRYFGHEEVHMVVGFNADLVEQHLGDTVHYIHNERHGETNSLYSLWLARDCARQGFLLFNGDVLFDCEVLRRLLHSPYPDALAVERRHRFDAEQMKIALEGDRVVKMSKTLPAEEAHAENLGIIKVSAAGAEVLFSRMEEILDNGGEKQFAPYAFNAIAPDYPLHAVPVDGLPWIEIDFVEDLIHARETVWPAIQQRKTSAPASGPAREPGLSPANPSSLPGD